MYNSRWPIVVLIKMDLNHGGVREEYQEIRSVFNNGRDHSGITSVLFDSLEELVWTGNQSVRKPLIWMGKIMSASFQQLYFLVKPWSRNCQNSIKTMYNTWKKCLFFVVFKMNDFVGCVDYYLNQFSYVIVLFHVLWQLSKKCKTQSRNLH